MYVWLCDLPGWPGKTIGSSFVAVARAAAERVVRPAREVRRELQLGLRRRRQVGRDEIAAMTDGGTRRGATRPPFRMPEAGAADNSRLPTARPLTRGYASRASTAPNTAWRHVACANARGFVSSGGTPFSPRAGW